MGRSNPHLFPSALQAGSTLNILEALRAGTTTFGDYSRPFAGWAAFYAEVGVRARLTLTINALPAGGMAGWKVGDLYLLDQTVDAIWTSSCLQCT